MWKSVAAVIEWLFDWLPSRGEKLRTELDLLQEERKKLLLGECNAKQIARIYAIDKRLEYIRRVFKNKD